MREYIIFNSEVFNFWFSVANLFIVIVGAAWAFYIYFKHRDNVRWEKNIDYGHEGIKCLTRIHLVFPEMFGQKADSDQKIDNSLYEVQMIDNYSMDTRVKQIFQEAKTFEQKKRPFHPDVSSSLIDLVCIARKSKYEKLVVGTMLFQEMVTSVFVLNRDILNNCSAFAAGMLGDPKLIYELDSKFPKHYKDDNSILKIVMAASSVLELLFVDLMEEGDLKDENSFIYELTRYNVLKGLQSAQDLKGVNDIRTLEALGMDLLLQQRSDLFFYNLTANEERRLFADVTRILNTGRR